MAADTQEMLKIISHPITTMASSLRLETKIMMTNRHITALFNTQVSLNISNIENRNCEIYQTFLKHFFTNEI